DEFDMTKLNKNMSDWLSRQPLGHPMISLIIEKLRSDLYSYKYTFSDGSEEYMRCEDSVDSGCEDLTPNESKIIHNRSENGKS
ncbi:hypothetical protein PENTCL1PPCAC_8302, partial [Pristionchus entomophagus]